MLAAPLHHSTRRRLLLVVVVMMVQGEVSREYKDLTQLSEADIGSKVWIRARVQNVRAKVSRQAGRQEIRKVDHNH